MVPPNRRVCAGTAMVHARQTGAATLPIAEEEKHRYLTANLAFTASVAAVLMRQKDIRQASRNPLVHNNARKLPRLTYGADCSQMPWSQLFQPERLRIKRCLEQMWLHDALAEKKTA